MKKKLLLILLGLCLPQLLLAQVENQSYQKGDFILSFSIGHQTSKLFRSSSILSLPSLAISGDMVVAKTDKLTFNLGGEVNTILGVAVKGAGLSGFTALAKASLYYELPLQGLYLYTYTSAGAILDPNLRRTGDFQYDIAMLGIHRLFINNLAIYFEVNPFSIIPIAEVSVGHTAFRLGASFKI